LLGWGVPYNRLGAEKMHVIWITVIGFVATVIAKLVAPGDHEPQGIVGAFVPTYLGQASAGMGRTRMLVLSEPSWAR
jgi:uncharacterized membrane protein YeaQ/YmgE (transglycosylase-associated protein family)